MTSPECRNGTERCAEALAQLARAALLGRGVGGSGGRGLDAGVLIAQRTGDEQRDPAEGQRDGQHADERRDDLVLLVGDHPHLFQVDADIGQVFGDVADVLVLGPPGQDFAPSTRRTGMLASIGPPGWRRFCASAELEATATPSAAGVNARVAEARAVLAASVSARNTAGSYQPRMPASAGQWEA